MFERAQGVGHHFLGHAGQASKQAPVTVDSASHENHEVNLPLAVKHIECLVGALDQVEIRPGENSVTDSRQASPVDELW